jgi:hypothetical protein
MMEPFDSQSIHLIKQLRPKKMLDFGSGNPPRFAITACDRFPELEIWCVDVQPVEEHQRIYFLPNTLFIETSSGKLEKLRNTFNFAHSAFAFHEICSDWERGEQIGGIHTPEAKKALSSIYLCLQTGALFELIDYVACEFYDFLQASRRYWVLKDSKFKKLADIVYEACIRTEPTEHDFAPVVTLLVSEFGRDQAEMQSLLLRLFVEYPRLPGPQIAAEKDELIRLIMHFRKYKDHHTRCPPDRYKERLREVGFRISESWTPDGTRYQFLCTKK